MSCVVALYLLFSVIGLVGGISPAFLPIISFIVLVNIAVWAVAIWRARALTASH